MWSLRCTSTYYIGTPEREISLVHNFILGVSGTPAITRNAVIRPTDQRTKSGIRREKPALARQRTVPIGVVGKINGQRKREHKMKARTQRDSGSDARVTLLENSVNGTAANEYNSH